MKKLVIVLVIFSIVFINCEQREWNNPYDTGDWTYYLKIDNIDQIDPDTIELQWSFNENNFDGYYIERKTNDNKWKKISGLIDKKKNKWYDSNIDPGTEYKYKLYAVAGDFISNSELVSVTTEVTLPEINTISIHDISTTEIICECELISNGGSSIERQGVCWRESEFSGNSDYFLDNNLIYDSTNSIYSITISDLKPNTKYYIRTFAQNYKGISYGNVLSISTEEVLIKIEKESETLIAQASFTNNNNKNIIEKGICWDTNCEVSINDNKILSNDNIESFKCNLSSMSQTENCFIRSFVTTEEQTYYSPKMLSFTPNEVFIDSRDNKLYLAVNINNQVWFSENLAYKPLSGIYYTDYDDGFYYYNWTTANSACPEGWHLPSVQEWEELTESVGGIEFAFENLGSIEWGASNSSGFNAEPDGYYSRNQYWDQLWGYGSFYWTSNYNDYYYFGYHINIDEISTEEYSSTSASDYYLTVRCVKD